MNDKLLHEMLDIIALRAIYNIDIDLNNRTDRDKYLKEVNWSSLPLWQKTFIVDNFLKGRL